ncbi:MAG: PKD domain-containing protein [Flavobacteriales bacterium]|nr:PKD domain-containing protein [Flavobacteriales bacterium]
MTRVRWTLLFAALLTFSTAVSQTFQANNTSGCAPLGVVISVTSPAPGSISSYNWQITTPSGATLTSTSPQYISILTLPGNYDVTLTINGTQTTTIQDYISVHALPVANFVVDDDAGCFPLCVNFSDISVIGEGDIVEWSWDFGDGGSSTDENPMHCYNQTGTFTPVFSVEDEFGCFADITLPGLIQVVDHFPNAVFALSNQLDCNPPVDISMTNSSTGETTLSSIWEFGDGGTQTVNGIDEVSHTFQSTGIFDVCLTVADDVGCSDQICHPVEIFSTANATFTVNPLTGCEGDVFTFTSTTTPVPPVTEWDFDGDGIADATGITATYTYADAGSFIPSLEVSYSSGCVDTQVGPATMTIQEGTDVSFEADVLESCSFPFNVHFENLSVGPGVISYEWFVDGTSVGASTDLVYTFNDYGLYDIRLVATSSSGCENEFELIDYITVQLPTVHFNHAPTACTNQLVSVFDVLVNTVDTVEFYYWDFDGDGLTDAEGLAPEYMYTTPGFYPITLTIQTESGCTASYTNPNDINVLTEVDANFTVSTTTTCAGEPVEFCVTEQPGNTFSWNFYDGSGWVIMSLSEDCITHDFPDTGWFDVSLTVFNGACNIMQTMEDLIYVEPPVAIFEYQVMCGELSATFNDISIGADSIVWDFGDGSGSLINEHTPTHIFPASGTYTILLTAFANGSDCPDTQSVDITVSSPNANLSFTPNNGCPPLDVDIHCEVFNPHWDVTFSSGDHIVVNWMANQGYWHITHTWNDGAQSFAFSNPDYFWWPSVIIEEGGFVDVTVTTTDANGCSVDLFYDDAIHVSSNPDFASFSTTTIDACNNVNLGFEPDLGNLTSWQWIFSDGSISTSESPFHTFQPPYNYDQPLSATLTATDSLGCTSTVTQEINVVLPPVVNFIAASDPSCVGDEVQFVNYSVGPDDVTYAWDFGDPTSSENTSTLAAPTHVFEANGTYEVCLNADNGAGCVRSYCNDQAVHIVDPDVSFDFTSTINNCLYGVQFVNTTPGTVVNSVWDFGDEQGGFGIMAFHTYPIGVYDVSLTVVNNYGCEATLVVPDILNYGNQVGPFTQLLDTAVCAPFEVSIAAFNPADTYFEYFWDFNDGSGDPSGNTSTTHTYTVPGTYCPSVIMTDPNGCPVLVACTDSIVVEEFVLSYQVPQYLCAGDTAYVTIENATSYVWQDMSEISNGATANEFLLHPSDDYDFLLTGYYADCVRTDTIHIEVKDLPTLTLSEDPLVCHLDNTFDLITGSPSDPPGFYTVNGIETTAFDPSWAENLNYVVEYFYTDTFSCSNSVSQNIFIKPLPIVQYADLGNFCLDADTIILQGATPIGGSYTLNNDTINYFVPQSGTGTYDIVYGYVDSDGCAASDTSTIIVRPIPEISIQAEDVCHDLPLNIINETAIQTGVISSTVWNIGNNVVSNEYTPPTVIFDSTGTQQINMTSTSDYGCVASIDTSIFVHAFPLVVFSHGDACQYSEQVFYDYSTISTDSIVSWTWNIAGTEITSPDSLVYTFMNYGEIDISLTPVSSFGCDDTLTHTIQIFPAPWPIVEIEDGCFGIESHFAAASTIAEGMIMQEEWSFGDGHPNEFGNTADNLYETQGTYQVVYIATSANGCASVYSDSIEIHPLPIPDIVIGNEATCEGKEVQLLDLSTVELPSVITDWLWSVENGTSSAQQNTNLVMDEAGTFDLTLTVTTNHGCTADSTLFNALTVYPNPNAGFTCEDELSYTNPLFHITNTSSEDVTNWYYDFGDETFEIFPEGEHQYEDHGHYFITQSVWNTFGCRDTTSKLVVVNPQLLVFVPTAFTPDVNGHNEVFYPVVTGFDITHYQFRIYDRWGMEVYSSDTPFKGWNGTYLGEPAQDGSYVSTLELRTATDVTIQRTNGSVILLR